MPQVALTSANPLRRRRPRNAGCSGRPFDRLASQHALGIAYQSDGQIKKAVALLEQVVGVEEWTLAQEHPLRLVSQYNPAIAYQANAQIPQAVELLKHVAAVGSRTLREDHPDRLASLSALENALEVATQ
jgi:tetratricopeptide (TPR) repeat protein